MMHKVLGWLWYRAVVLSIGMMLFLGVMGAFWIMYWLAFALWGPS